MTFVYGVTVSCVRQDGIVSHPLYGTPVNDPSFTIPETNRLLGDVVERLARQDERLAAAERQGRIVLMVATATLVAALAAVVVAIVAL